MTCSCMKHRWDPSCPVHGILVRDLDAAAQHPRLTDGDALDQLNEMLSAPEWPGASGLEDVLQIVRATGRTEVADAPTWHRH